MLGSKKQMTISVNLKSKKAKRDTDELVGSLNKLNRTADGTQREFKQTSRSARKTGTEFVNMRHKTHGLQRSFGTLRNQILVAKYALTVIGVYGAGRFVRDSVRAAASVQQWGLSFEVMTGSAQLAKQTMEELSEFAMQSSFDLPDVVSNAKQLMGMGIELENVIPTMKMLGDTAAGLGVPLQRLALNFGQVKSQGKLTGRELRDFAISGVPLLETLANSMGKTKQEITAMVSESKIGFTDVRNAFIAMTSEGGKFNNLMQRTVNETLAGKVSNLRDQFFRLRAEIGNELLPVVSDVADELQRFIGEKIKTGEIKALAESMGSLAESLIDLGNAAVENRKSIKNVGLALGAFFILPKIARSLIATSGVWANFIKKIATGTKHVKKFGIAAKPLSVALMALIPSQLGLDRQEELNQLIEDGYEKTGKFRRALFAAEYGLDSFTEADELAYRILKGYTKTMGEARFKQLDFIDSTRGININVGEQIRLLSELAVLNLDEIIPSGYEPSAISAPKVENLSQATFAGYIDALENERYKKEQIAKWNKIIIEHNKELAESMGLLDEESKETFTNMTAQAQAWASQISDVLYQSFNGQFDNIEDRWKNMLKRMAADFAVSGLFSLFGAPGGVGMFGEGNLFGGLFHNGGSVKNNAGTPVRAASGMNDFVVPSGYPNDSFPIMVESGEHVNVTSAANTRSGFNEIASKLDAVIGTIKSKPVAYTRVLADEDIYKRSVKGRLLTSEL
jgi:tape measure domain-containing protein